jgi:hypothetical protein
VRYLQSFSPFEIDLPSVSIDGQNLPRVVLPKRHQSPQEAEAGKCDTIELDDLACERLEIDHNFKGMLLRGQYKWVDGMPDKFMTMYEREESKARELRGLRVKMISIGAEPFSAGIEPFGVMEPRS